MMKILILKKKEKEITYLCTYHQWKTKYASQVVLTTATALKYSYHQNIWDLSNDTMDKHILNYCKENNNSLFLSISAFLPLSLFLSFLFSQSYVECVCGIHSVVQQ